MHLIHSLKNEFCFDLPMFSKYPATSINSYFYKMTLRTFLLMASLFIFTLFGGGYFPILDYTILDQNIYKIHTPFK